MPLDKLQRNAVFEALVSAQRDPRDFEFSEGSLIHRASGSMLSMLKAGDQFFVIYNVGDGDQVQRNLPTWDHLLAMLPQWFRAIDHYSAMPDLWAEFTREPDVIAVASALDVEVAPFTESERSEVLKQLAEIRRYAETALRLSGDKMDELNGRLLYLEDATTRVGKKDWLTLAVGTVVQLALDAVLPPGEVRNVFTMLLHPLSHLFGHPLPQLPPV